MKKYMVLVHNIIMTGPPGAGKTLLARSMPSILPRLTLEEALDITRIYSVADMLPPDMPLIWQRPFRAPHHTISNAGLVGGGRVPARFPWPTGASSFSTSCPSSAVARWKWRPCSGMYLQLEYGQPLPEAHPFASLRTSSGPLLDRVDIHVTVPRV